MPQAASSRRSPEAARARRVTAVRPPRPVSAGRTAPSSDPMARSISATPRTTASASSSDNIKPPGPPVFAMNLQAGASLRSAPLLRATAGRSTGGGISSSATRRGVCRADRFPATAGAEAAGKAAGGQLERPPTVASLRAGRNLDRAPKTAQVIDDNIIYIKEL